MKPGPNATPKKFGQNTAKENMVRILTLTTQHTSIGARSATPTNLVRRRQPASECLPHKDLNLGWDTSPPDHLELGSIGAGYKLGVKRLDRKTPDAL